VLFPNLIASRQQLQVFRELQVRATSHASHIQPCPYLATRLQPKESVLLHVRFNVIVFSDMATQDHFFESR
jgi:hypothetical protein